MRLIDADNLRIHISELMLVYSDTELDCEILNAIDNAPTVELVMSRMSNGVLIPLRLPGEWIKKVDDAGFVSYICSLCGAEIEVEDCSDDKFCFNCGAYMKGGAE